MCRGSGAGAPAGTGPSCPGTELLKWLRARHQGDGALGAAGREQLFTDSQLLKKTTGARWNPWALKPNGTQMLRRFK